MRNTVERRRTAIQLAPNATSGILLGEIMFVCQRDKLVEWGGERFFARTTEDWADATGLSLRQITRSLASLREAGLIETEQHIFAGKTVNHVRPTLSASGQPGETHCGQPRETEGGQLPILDEDEDVDGMKTAEAGTGDEMEPRKTPSGKRAMSADVAAILKLNDAKVELKFSPEALDEAMKIAIKQPTRARLGDVFMISWVLAGYALRPGLTVKEMKQLSNLVDACEDTKVGVFLIAEMVEKWDALAAYLKQSYKKSAPPERPNIGYALAAKVSVVAWLRDQVAQGETQALAQDEEEELWDL